MERDGEKTFEYYDKSRLDGILKLEVGLEYVREYYEHRKDRYSNIFIEFADSYPISQPIRNYFTSIFNILFFIFQRFLMFREFSTDKSNNKNLIVSIIIFLVSVPIRLPNLRWTKSFFPMKLDCAALSVRVQ